MKRLALFLLPAAMAFMAAGCAVVELEQVGKEEPAKDEILVHKSFKAGTVDTRTTLDGKKVVFSKGESISIYDGSANREFKADEAGSNVSFSGEVSSTATEFYAMSPYSGSTTFAKSGSTVTARTSLASVQVATPGSFEDGMNISAAKADSYDQFSLVNVMSLAKFTLTSANLDGHRVMSVELSSSHPLAGDVVLTYGETPSVAAGSNSVNEVTLAKADGSSLGDGSYYMVLLPNAGGEIVLKFADADGYTAVKTATLKSAFEAGSIKNLGTVKGLEWEAPCYKKVTSAPDDWSGDYLMVYEDEGQILTGISEKNVGTPGDVTINDDNTISWESYKQYNIAIAKSGNGYTLDLNNSGYLGWTSGNSLTCTTAESVNNNYRWNLSMDSDGNVTIKNLATPERILQYNAGSPRFCAYTSKQKLVQLYKRTNGDSAPISGPASVTLTTGEATNVTAATATLNASFSGLSPLNAQEVGFYWGTDPSALDNVAYDTNFVPQESGSISAILKSLEPETTYYFQATMQVWDRASNSYKEFKGEVKSFTTLKAYVPAAPHGWLELPAITGSEDYLGTFYSGTERNYSYNYSSTWFASLWEAYPLTIDHTYGSASTNKWSFVPKTIIPTEYQVNITKNSYGTSFGNSDYARGHQVPNGDRKSDDTMNEQTYYTINQTPQLQNKFNGSIWNNLETAARSEVGKVDTLYVVTGPAYKTNASEDEITYLYGASGITPAQLRVPDYYWKAFLKVKWENGKVKEASSIAFWFEHREYDSDKEKYDQNDPSNGKPPFFCSVDTLEELIGFDLFTNLPDELEATVETNSSWTTFKNFKQ